MNSPDSLIGESPKPKIVHRAKYIAPNGDVSALYFNKPHAIDLAKATWTNRDDAVTCKKCKERRELSIPKEAFT